VAMLRAGLLEEVAELLGSGSLNPDSPAGLAIGYRQVIEYLTRPQPREGDEEALGNFLRTFGSATRGYARSQAHWFAKDARFTWLPANPGEPGDPSRLGQEILKLAQLPAVEFRAVAAPIDAEVRSSWAHQGGTGAGAESAFRSCLDCAVRRRAALGEEAVARILATADACVRRIPESFRQTAPELAAVRQLALPGNLAGSYGKVFWYGKHRVWGWGNPLSKLHKQGLQVLEAHGWRAIDESDASMLPAFCWCTRQAADFPAMALEAEGSDEPMQLPLLRPFPQSFTDRLDDKGELIAHLRAAGLEELQPPTWAAEDFLRQPDEAAGEHAVAALEKELWFLKHNRGVKGNGVHAFNSAIALRRKLEELGQKGRRTFVVQRGVAPPSLRGNRKWMLRVHALLHVAPGVGLSRAFCHKDMILVEHGHVYTPDHNVRAAHISSAGQPKYWPRPTLLDCEETAEQVRGLVARTFAAVWRHLPTAPLSPPEAELCQMFGFDFAADADGRMWLLEVNSYPAIASGTMDHVEPQVYTSLVRDVLSLVVLPCIEAATRSLGGFSTLDVERFVPERV